MAAGSGDDPRTNAADTVQQILAATSLFGRLQLPDAVLDGSAVKHRYRQLALLVHPDKCRHELAKEAFQKLGEAFDSLSSESGQRRYLGELSGGRRSGPAAQKRRPRADKDRWWDTKTWEEFEHRFRHRDAAEAALHKEFASKVKAKYSGKRMRSQVLAAERSIEQCDRGAGYPESELWPPELRVKAGAAEQAVESCSDSHASSAQGFEERPELEDPRVALARLLDLLTHLRTVHRFCMYCGCVYDSFEDLERNCPGFTEDEHDNSPNMAARTSTETAIEVAGQLEEFAEDPLDAFMAGMQDELHKDLKKSATSTKRRNDGTQKGWSFEQQAQQNKNERKSSKRGR